MPWVSKSGKAYNLVYLDTNALSEISKNQFGCQVGFMKKFPATQYAPCFSVYNLREIKQATKAYEHFIEFFSNYSFLLLVDYRTIIREEMLAYNTIYKPNIILSAFNYDDVKDQNSFRNLLSNLWNDEFISQLEIEDQNIKNLAELWGKRRTPNINNPLFSSRSTKFSNDYQIDNTLLLLHHLEPQWLRENMPILINKFPAARVLIFTHFKKIFQANTEVKKNDVFDVMISSVCPYIEAIVTESNQADVLKQGRKYIKELNKLSILKLREIRTEYN
ncbi:hypothetical protein [Paenibacillus sp. YN15]|uniref:hypothetical protein n=1 Tax=Paenibacillus sp. YN15 TaxID=1742774 RepID=UPI000DCAE36C|nr:hypothetical protein [Paenibacillus sp. YN15]RAU92167.1 hypothetical protein DQG13_28025 [Paenibacillus sp. YN15]